MIKKLIKKNRLVYLPQNKNLSFAKAINLGLKSIKSKKIYCLSAIFSIVSSRINQCGED